MADETPDLPYIEQVKIQARVLVPLVKALQAELGEERANRLVRAALGDEIRRAAAQMSREVPGTAIDKVAAAAPFFAGGGALDIEMVEQTPERFDFNVTGCRYAQFYQQLGVPELGFLLVCSLDFPMAKGFGPDLELERTQTIMQGASHCDFRFRRKPSSG